MRIAIATQNFFQPNNGQATFVRHLVEGLAAEGHAVLVIAPSQHGHAESLVTDDFRVEAVASLSLAAWYPDVYVTPWPDRAAARLLATFQPDIVHIQDHYPLCRGVVRAARKRSLPLIGTNHFLPENIIPFVPILSRFAWSRGWMERLLWRNARSVFDRLDLVTAPTETAAAILRRQGFRRPICAVSNGVDLNAFYPDSSLDRAAVRGRYSLDAERTLFVFVGRVDREKRLDVLLHAICLLNPGAAQLAIVGRGRERAAWEALTHRLGLEGQVTFTGYLTLEAQRALLNSADVFAMPSDVELQSLATLEAMAVGLPVLAANALALPELVTPEVNGYLFNAGDAADAARYMTRLAADKDRRRVMGAASLARARTHALGSTLRRYEALYRQVVASHQSSPMIHPAVPAA